MLIQQVDKRTFEERMFVCTKDATVYRLPFLVINDLDVYSIRDEVNSDSLRFTTYSSIILMDVEGI